jgi:hypothetical protein
VWLRGTRGCRSKNCRIRALVVMHIGVLALIRPESGVVVAAAASDAMERSRRKIISTTIGGGGEGIR